jgi:hypothetical protein
MRCTTLTPMGDAESTRGDLIFVTPDPQDPVEVMIQKYDRGDYTHVGIDDGAGHFLNCRLDQKSLREQRHGGVRKDALNDPHFAGRLFRARVKLPQTQKEKAAAFAEGLVDRGGVDSSGFSLAKMFACASAVDFSDESRGFHEATRSTVLAAARDVAVSWRYTEQFPFFFCAELVVVAYAAQVPAAYLPPPPPKGEPAPVDVDVPLVTGPLTTKHDNDARHRALAHLFFSVAGHDPRFFGEAGVSLIRWYRTKHDGADPGGGVQTRSYRPKPLPAGLVTPRMLLCCTDWVGKPVAL